MYEVWETTGSRTRSGTATRLGLLYAIGVIVVQGAYTQWVGAYI